MFEVYSFGANSEAFAFKNLDGKINGEVDAHWNL